MLIQSIREMDCSKKEIRKSAFAVGFVLSIIGLLLLWKGKDYYQWFLTVSALLVLLGVFAPILLKPFHRAWMTVALLLGWIMTRVILGLFYYLVFTPIALLKRLFSKDTLGLTFDTEATTYWIEKKEQERKKDSYEKQF